MFQPVPNTQTYDELLKIVGQDAMYDELIHYVYDNEEEYAQICNDILHTNRILKDYAETNVEFYSANIFNNTKKFGQKISILNSMIVKRDKLKGTIDVDNWKGTHICVKQLDVTEMNTKYVVVDYYKNSLIELTIQAELLELIIFNNDPNYQAVEENVRGLYIELLSVLSKYSSCIIGDIKDVKKYRYFIVDEVKNNNVDNISIQFSPENEGYLS